MKTSELTGAALNWAVGVAQGMQWESDDPDVGLYHRSTSRKRYVVVPLDYATMEDWSLELYAPPTDWMQGGPIIEREGISVIEESDRTWTADIYRYTDLDTPLYSEQGRTPLIAAMRCYVASKLGYSIDVPAELSK
jgi:hypothetical protein